MQLHVVRCKVVRFCSDSFFFFFLNKHLQCTYALSYLKVFINNYSVFARLSLLWFDAFVQIVLYEFKLLTKIHCDDNMVSGVSIP